MPSTAIVIRLSIRRPPLNNAFHSSKLNRFVIPKKVSHLDHAHAIDIVLTGTGYTTSKADSHRSKADKTLMDKAVGRPLIGS